MQTVSVNLAERSYDIVITSDDTAGVGPFARTRAQASLAFLVGDEHVRPHAQATEAALTKVGFRTHLSLLPSGETQKSLTVASQLYDRLADLRADRKTLVVAVGGGVIGDLAGFVAATFNRGLPLLMVPTTLLAMVDSSVGGKVGINHPKAKNLIGAFHQPVGVWIDTATLATLPEREYRSGLAEVVKYGVIGGADFLSYLEANAAGILAREPERVRYIVNYSCCHKAKVVEQDEREVTGVRAALNYGHTFAHAFEAVAGYGAWLHGEAVAAGMVCASRLAERRGLVSRDFTQCQIQLLQRFGLPTAPLSSWPIDALLAAMRSDKKALAGRMRFVLPTAFGEVSQRDDVAEEDVRRVLEACSARE
jgi:3-dehydroquinate synthase